MLQDSSQDDHFQKTSSDKRGKYYAALLLTAAAASGAYMYRNRAGATASADVAQKDDLVAIGLDARFVDHCAEYGLSFRTKQEYQFRQELYMAADREINLINSDETNTFEAGHNHLSTLTKDEKSRWYGLKIPEGAEDAEPTFLPAATATSVDWRTKGAVNAVKNQKSCGSCWSFATTNVVEGHHAIDTGKLLDLSEQQLVDCSKSSHGCNGGWPASAMRSLSGGQTTTTLYPYKAKDGTCAAASFQKEVKVTKTHVVPQGSAAQLLAAIEKGPVSVALQAAGVFSQYKSGILNSAACGSQLDHAVNAVGYGVQGGQQYYIIRNSWGPYWGESGYARLATVPTGKGICGVQQFGSSWCETAAVQNNGGGGGGTKPTPKGCTAATPCDVGQGDCDTNADCKGKLECFQRSKGEAVPGVDTSKFAADFDVCYNPDFAGLVPANNRGAAGCQPASPAAAPCGLGEGDCDSDADCGGALKCYQRSHGEATPGLQIAADMPKDYDFCYDPAWAATNRQPAENRGAAGCSPTNTCGLGQGDCDSDADCAGSLTCFQRQHGETVPGVRGANGPGMPEMHDFCYHADWQGHSPAENRGVSGCTAAKTCGVGQGDCDSNDDCLGSLECFQRSHGESVPGVSDLGNIPTDYDVCYDPTWNGTMPAENRGWSGCSPQSTCGVGQGDCDGDADCATGLECYQRSSGEAVPGVDTTGMPGDLDVCYDPDHGVTPGNGTRARYTSWTACTESVCGLGEGDCDDDSECAGNLQCFQRDGAEPVPGLTGMSRIPDGADLCYDPTYGTNLVTVVNKGASGCSVGSPCGLGQGDCDHDDECSGTLSCFQRNSGESIPGLAGLAAVPANYDFCYDPAWTGDMPAENRGVAGCGPEAPCGLGQGDCDSDYDCVGDLQCFQRDNGENIPGVVGLQSMPKDYDFCY